MVDCECQSLGVIRGKPSADGTCPWGASGIESRHQIRFVHPTCTYDCGRSHTLVLAAG